MSQIEIHNVTKIFKNNVAIKNINLCCKSGEIVGIVGHNGSGKTVLFKCICGLLKVTSGEIRVDGKLLGKDFDMLPKCGVIIEEPAFIARYSGINNLKLQYMIRNSVDLDYLKDVMRQVGLDPNVKKRVAKYSMGMRQRLAIAQAIMENPEILILDEPMNGLDHTGVEQMRKLFLKLKEQGKTILLASHNKEDINILCDQVYEMEMGNLKLVED